MLARTTFFEVESLVTKAANSFTISGYNIGVNINVTVAPTTLPLCFQTEEHLYYVAPFGAISYTGNYSIDELDFVGLRVSKEDGGLSWFLDQNSRSRYPRSHNTRYTAKASDVVYSTARSRVTGRDGQTTALYYRGYFDGKVHFALQDSAEHSGGDRELFQFNIDQAGLPELIAIKGLTLEVVAVNTTHLECRWIEIQ